jgi:hypothetical protein
MEHGSHVTFIVNSIKFEDINLNSTRRMTNHNHFSGGRNTEAKTNTEMYDGSHGHEQLLKIINRDFENS